MSLSQAHMHKLLAHIRTRADQARLAGTTRAIVDELVVLTLLHAGLRPGELCALRIADTPAGHGKPELHVRPGPDTPGRVVHIPEETLHTFERFVRLHRVKARPKDLLLRSERGTPFSYMSLYSKVRRIGREAGVGKLHPAMLRQTFLVRLYESERDLRLVQEQAGHAQLKTTARHVRPRRSTRKCDACGVMLTPRAGRTIDSGQLLCPSCLRELRSH